MNEPNLRILQDTLAGLAFTKHFHMSQWTRPFSDLFGPHLCGTSLCLGGLATTLELSKAKQNYQPTLDNLSHELLHEQLHDQWLAEDNCNFFIFHASRYLGIPYDNVAPIWHKHVWPTTLVDLYDTNGSFTIRQKYLLTFPNSRLANYSVPTCFWKTLSGLLALEAFHEYTSDPKDSESWVKASAQAIEGDVAPDAPDSHTYLPLWLTKYSDRIIHFESIAIQSGPAKKYVPN